MRVNFSQSSKDYLQEVKFFIEKDSKLGAKQHVSNLIGEAAKLLQHPRVGKINQIYNREDIREVFILVLMIYKNIDFDEESLFNQRKRLKSLFQTFLFLLFHHFHNKIESACQKREGDSYNFLFNAWFIVCFVHIFSLLVKWRSFYPNFSKIKIES